MDCASPLSSFVRFDFEHDGIVHPVFRTGAGPAVVVMHEVPGLYPADIQLGLRLADQGFSVYMPSLVGVPGKEISLPYVLASFARVCISREFFALRSGESSPVTVWLRALCRRAHRECGGPGVGCIGMCLSGGFGLAMMLEPSVIAPVLSQPSLPAPVGKERALDLGLNRQDLELLKERVSAGACVLGLRFTHDRWVPKARFDRLRAELGQGFEAIEIDSSAGNEHGIGRFAHSVLAYDLVDRPGHPTHDALLRVFSFLRERLAP